MSLHAQGTPNSMPLESIKDVSGGFSFCPPHVMFLAIGTQRTVLPLKHGFGKLQIGQGYDGILAIILAFLGFVHPPKHGPGRHHYHGEVDGAPMPHLKVAVEACCTFNKKRGHV